MLQKNNTAVNVHMNVSNSPQMPQYYIHSISLEGTPKHCAVMWATKNRCTQYMGKLSVFIFQRRENTLFQNIPWFSEEFNNSTVLN